MAAAFDQTVTSTAVSASSEDIGPITPGGSDRFLVWYDALGQTSATRTLNSITHNAKTGNSRWDSGRFGNYYQTHCHTLTNPDAVSSVVTGAFSGGSDHGGGIVATFTGVDQTTPFEGLQSNQANDDAPSLTVTSETDDLVVDCIGGDGASLSVSGGGTEIAALPNIASYTGLGMAYEAGAASVVRSWTWTDGPYFYHAFNLNASGGTIFDEIHVYTATGTLAMTKGTVFAQVMAYTATGSAAMSKIPELVRAFTATATATVTKEIEIIRGYTATGASALTRGLIVTQLAVMTATGTVSEALQTFVEGVGSKVMKAYLVFMASLFGFRGKK